MDALKLTVLQTIEWLKKFPPEYVVNAGSEHQSGDINIIAPDHRIVGRATNNGETYPQ